MVVVLFSSLPSAVQHVGAYMQCHSLRRRSSGTYAQRGKNGNACGVSIIIEFTSPCVHYSIHITRRAGDWERVYGVVLRSWLLTYDSVIFKSQSSYHFVFINKGLIQKILFVNIFYCIFTVLSTFTHNYKTLLHNFSYNCCVIKWIVNKDWTTLSQLHLFYIKLQ